MAFYGQQTELCKAETFICAAFLKDILSFLWTIEKEGPLNTHLNGSKEFKRIK